MFEVSAPGKIILSGEHSVVYGQPAILSTVGFFNQATVQSNLTNICHCQFNEVFWDFDLSDVSETFQKSQELFQLFQLSGDSTLLKQIIGSAKDFVLIAIGEFLDFYDLWNSESRFNLKIRTQVPMGGGFGSSASLAAVIVGALANFYLNSLDREEVFEIVQKMESKVHGNPSGADASAVIFGGQLVFRRGVGAKIFQSILDLNDLGLVLVDSGQPFETTGEMVSRVREYVNDNSSKVIEDMGNISSQVQRSLELGSAERFLELIQQNQRCLEKIGVVSESSCKFIKEIESNGGVAKMAGAGGFEQGSGVVLIFGLDRGSVKKIAQEFRFSVYPKVNLGGLGLINS